MPRTRFYFQSHDIDSTGGEAGCQTIAGHLDDMRFNEETERVLTPAAMEKGVDHFYCRYHGEVGLKDEGCGRECKGYSPRNGKNGRCRHSANTYMPSGDTDVILTLDGKLKPVAEPELAARG